MSTLSARFGWSGLKERLASRFKRETAVPIRDWNGPSGQPVRLLGFDQALVWMVVSLLALGLVMVYSASVALPAPMRFEQIRMVQNAAIAKS